MGASDGTVLGLTKILDNGPDNQRFNIVIVAEGFRNTTADQTAFNDRCQQIVDAFRAEPWFSEGLLAAINIHRLNVTSTNAGADDPATCADMSTGTGGSPATFFDSTFCTAGVRRCLGADWGLVRSTINARLATWHAGVVLVNSTMRGGCASGNVFTTALSGDWLDVVMHELGHAAFGLGDEYSTWQGCGSGETDRDNAPGGEPTEPNITATSGLAGLKWGHLVGPLTPVPTMQNPDCSQCDLRANVRPDDLEIGLYEGAGYYHCGYHRPAYACKMRSSSRPFCRVCVDAIHTRLRPFFQAMPALAASVSELDFGNVGAGSTAALTFEISSVGTVAVSGIALTSSSPNFAAAPATIASLAPGAWQTITVTFGPVFATGPRTGTLSINSDAAPLSIDLRANVCTPAPSMQIVTPGGGLTLNFGDVGRLLTMYRWFEVRNLRTPCPAQLRVTLPPAPAGFGYAPGTSLSFTLPMPSATQPFTSRRVYVAFSSPAAGGPGFNGTLTVTTPDDPVTSSVSIMLAANAIDPPPVDSVLVIDRSGSMSEPTGVPGASKMTLAIQAASLYVSLLKDNDRIGIVRFNNVAANPGDVLQPLVVAGVPTTGAGRVSALGALTPANLTPNEATSIGGGTILGSTVLDGAVATARAIVVLTDGIQNRSPDIPTASMTVAGKSPRQRVFAVGLGLNQLEDSLNQLASVNNGVAQITGELAGDREFLLQKLYVQILSDVADEAFVQDPTEILHAGAAQATDIWIGEVDVAADFILVYRKMSVYPLVDLWLEAPDGAEIRPSDAGTIYPNVAAINGDGHLYFRVQFPAFPARPRAHIGRWRLWLENIGPRRALTHVAVGGTGGAGPSFVYSVMAKARSDLRLGGYVVQPSYLPGSTMTIMLEPTLYGQPVRLDAPVEAKVTRPDGVTRIVTLAEAAYGQYRGTFDDTGLRGVYPIAAAVHATTPLGNRVTRYRHLTGLIFRRGEGGPGGPPGGGRPGGGPGGGGPGGEPGGGHDEKSCREAMVMLRRLESLLARCGEHDREVADQAKTLLIWLRGFIDDCCRGRRREDDEAALRTTLTHARALLD